MYSAVLCVLSLLPLLLSLLLLLLSDRNTTTFASCAAAAARVCHATSATLPLVSVPVISRSSALIREEGMLRSVFVSVIDV